VDAILKAVLKLEVDVVFTAVVKSVVDITNKAVLESVINTLVVMIVNKGGPGQGR
jgi:hypothetical protein